MSKNRTGSRAKKEALKKTVVRALCLILAITMVASTLMYILFYLFQ